VVGREVGTTHHPTLGGTQETLTRAVRARLIPPLTLVIRQGTLPKLVRTSRVKGSLLRTQHRTGDACL
jgi:hypothetical protein